MANTSKYLVEISDVKGEIWIRNMTNPAKETKRPSKELLIGLSLVDLKQIALDAIESHGQKIVDTAIKHENQNFQSILIFAENTLDN